MNQPLSFFEPIGELMNGMSNDSRQIECIFINSREQVRNGLFIPIKGERFDGHDFLLQAISNGAIASYWNKDKPLPPDLPVDFPVILVEDTTIALQKTAERYLSMVKPYVVAITGSNGKTTTKDLISSLVEQQFQSFKTLGNYNNHLGMPLTILSMKEDCEVLILEMGMSNLGEISFLSRLAKPDYAVITNIGESHLEQLGSREKIAEAKMEIRDGLKSDGITVIDGDEPILKHIANETNVITCGYGSNCDVVIKNVSGNEDGQYFTLNHEETKFYLPLLGKHNIKNAVYAIVIAKKLGISDFNIQKGLKNTTLTAMRLQRLKGKNNSLLINDAYNASPSSMKAGIESLELLTEYNNKIAVLGDMYELGENEKELHQSVAKSIGENIQTVICVGEKGKWIGEALQERKWNGTVILCDTKEDAESHLDPLLTSETVVLFKASRGMKLETLIDKVRLP